MGWRVGVLLGGNHRSQWTKKFEDFSANDGIFRVYPTDQM